MLEQLWDYWCYYKGNEWGNIKAGNEVRYWLEQHSVNADDFAFNIAVLMLRYLAKS